MSIQNIAIVIQARMGSSRYPGKVLSDFCGMPMLEYQIRRLRSFNLEMPIILATSSKKNDDPIEHLSMKLDCYCYRGDEANVFGRFQDVVRHFKLKDVVRLTGDNPLPSKHILAACLHSHVKKSSDLTTTRELVARGKITRFVPKGLSVDILSGERILEIDINSLDDYELEHVIPVFFNRNYNINILKNFEFPDLDLSVDTIADKDRVIEFVKNNNLEF